MARNQRERAAEEALDILDGIEGLCAALRRTLDLQAQDQAPETPRSTAPRRAPQSTNSPDSASTATTAGLKVGQRVRVLRGRYSRLTGEIYMRRGTTQWWIRLDDPYQGRHQIYVGETNLALVPNRSAP